MSIILWVIASPFLVILWWAIVLAVIDYAIHVGRQEQENKMTTFTNSKGETVERQRLIRYTNLADAEHPNLLSAFDKGRNLQMIDQNNAAELPPYALQQLEMTETPATMLSADGLGFVAYNQ